MESFTNGDLVRLKSGGPIMTVQTIVDDEQKTVSCSWFNEKELKTGVFHPDSLEIAP